MAEKIVPANPRKGIKIDRIAYRLIERFYPHVLTSPQPFPVEQFFEFDLEEVTGVSTDYQRLPIGIHGITDSERQISLVDVSLLDTDNEAELRYAYSTIAHECGHVIIHVPEFRRKRKVLRSIQDKDEASLKMYRRESIKIYMNPEWQAHRFAGALLVPERTLRMALRETGNDRELADIFDVNPAFIRSRMKALKMRKGARPCSFSQV